MELLVSSISEGLFTGHQLVRHDEDIATKTKRLLYRPTQPNPFSKIGIVNRKRRFCDPQLGTRDVYSDLAD